MLREKSKFFFQLWVFCLTLAVPLELFAIEVGNLKVGGSMRVNYIYGDYEDDGSDGPQRGANGGNVEFELFQVKLDYQKERFIGKVDYRFYDGYHLMHSGWIGYNFENKSQLQVGVNRVPFGVGPFGPANSWFFDQHYYVGLADDMDMGIKYHLPLGKLGIDMAYYYGPEPEGMGDSDGGTRYSYDIVDDNSFLNAYPNGNAYSSYQERNQFNLRAIYAFDMGPIDTAAGISLQWGQLESQTSLANDSEAYAYAAHAKSKLGPWTLMLQLTQYHYDAEYTSGANNDLIAMSAFDFAWPVAAKGTIPSIALSYTWKPTGIDWIDSITFYNDYSIILKDGQQLGGTDFNDSAMNITGLAIANDGWYIYIDYAISNGNFFVGNKDDTYATFADASDFGVNGLDDWDGRFNINIGYYF